MFPVIKLSCFHSLNMTAGAEHKEMNYTFFVHAANDLHH